MTYSVDSFIVDGNDDIAYVTWKYTTANGSITHTDKLDSPVSTFDVSQVTTETLATWVEDQTGHTTQELEDEIDIRKANRDYVAGLTRYEVGETNTYVSVEDPANGDVFGGMLQSVLRPDGAL